MEDLLEIAILYLPTIVLSIVGFVLLINLYFTIRRRFLIKVNCWFCNEWTFVPYLEQNSFICSSCLQYNGFDCNGDYNRAIPEQQDELLNRPISKTCHSTAKTSASNGLCHLCNNNQQLKIFQLKNFVPLREENYDVEIEHFQNQLEKSYKLCPKCENVVKTTIRKQNRTLGLTITQLRRNGVSLLDLTKSTGGITRSSKLSFIKSFIQFSIFTFVVLNLGHSIMQLDLSNDNLIDICPTFLFPHILTVKELFVSGYKSLEMSSKWAEVEVLSHNFAEKLSQFSLNSTRISRIVEQQEAVMARLPESMKKGTIMLGFAGVTLQFLLVIWKGDVQRSRNLLQFLLWSFITFGHWTEFPYECPNVAQIEVSLLILFLLLSRRSSRPLPKMTKHVLRKEKEVDEWSDEEPDQHSTTFKNFCSNLNFSKENTAETPSYPLKMNEKHVFGQPGVIEPVFSDNRNLFNNRLNQTGPLFSVARNCTSNRSSVVDSVNLFNNSLVKNHSDQDVDKGSIEDIFNNLHLGSNIRVSSPSQSSVFTPSRPIISPAKLKSVTQNSWVAGGFWLDPNGLPLHKNSFLNVSPLSRSSSQTSGFVSQTGAQETQNLIPGVNSVCSEYDNASVFSEPRIFPYGKSYNFLCNRQQPVYYPLMNHEHYVCVAPNLPRYEYPTCPTVNNFPLQSPNARALSKSFDL